MNLNRREFTGRMLGAAATAALLPHALARGSADGTFFEWKRVGDGAWAGFGGGGNALLIASAGEALLIDCKSFGLGATLRREAAAIAGALTTVLNTHHHGDHTGGNHAFTPDLPLYAHVNAKPRIVESFTRILTQAATDAGLTRDRLIRQARGQAQSAAGADAVAQDVAQIFENLDALKGTDFAPTKLVHDKAELRVGELTALLRHIGPGHTDNDVFIKIPELNIVHTGDLLFHKLHPYIDMNAGASSAGWIAGCDAIIGVCDADTTVIPGHGEIADRTGVEEQKHYFQVVRQTMAEARRAGKSRDEAAAMTIEEFKGYGFQRIKERTFGSVYDEMG